MELFERTGLWAATLSRDAGTDELGGYRDRLRSAYLKFRGRSAAIAAEIPRDLAEFTVHDASHLDALWDLAGLIAGTGVGLNPAEAFVFGGAVLVHDLGLALAAYPGGAEALRREEVWLEVLWEQLKSTLGRPPTRREMEHPDSDATQRATREALVRLHAQRAQQLALLQWVDAQSGDTYHLIEDDDLRCEYGPIIGRIANSHWWPASQLPTEFGVTHGSPGFLPREWTVDPLKVACLLRAADACHLDSRRAPPFLMALRAPTGESREHWVAQRAMRQPQLVSDRLVYTSGQAFAVPEASAWWRCYDCLRMADSELRAIDALLSDLGRPRFAARGVAGAEDPKRLARHIPTTGWVAADARVRVTDVAGLAEKLGGVGLYGPDPTVPLRELVQNAADAVAARRIVEAAPGWGAVCVRIGADDGGHWIEVEDNGVGMSEEALLGPLLDFGVSYWGSSRMPHQMPELAAAGFQPAGRFGIGFFSAFMWGDRVRVTTRRYDAGSRDTLVLEFEDGLRLRPVLRNAVGEECLREGGTCVRAWLRTAPDGPSGLLYGGGAGQPRSLEGLCGWLCPALEVDLWCDSCDHLGGPTKAITAGDWRSMPGDQLLSRVARFEREAAPDGYAALLGPNLRPLYDDDGEVVGRACLAGFTELTSLRRLFNYLFRVERLIELGVTTAGGLRAATLWAVAGVLTGTPTDVTRRSARPIVGRASLATWASEQAALVVRLASEHRRLASAAACVHACGGDTGGLPIAQTADGWLTAADVAAWARPLQEVWLVEPSKIEMLSEDNRQLCLHPNVLVVSAEVRHIIEEPSLRWPSWPTATSPDDEPPSDRTLRGLALEMLGAAWDPSSEDLSPRAAHAGAATEREVEIGTRAGHPVRADACVVARPAS